MSGCKTNCQCPAGETSPTVTVLSIDFVCPPLCFDPYLLLELLFLAHFVSQEVVISLDVKAIANVLAGSLGLAPEEAILKATSKMLTSTSPLLTKMKRSMILKTSITRMKSWTKLLLLPKPRGRTGFQLG